MEIWFLIIVGQIKVKLLFAINSFWVFPHSLVQIHNVKIHNVKMHYVDSTAVAFLHTGDQMSLVHIYILY